MSEYNVHTITHYTEELNKIKYLEVNAVCGFLFQM